MPIQQLYLGAGGKPLADGSSSANAGTSAKQIYDDGYVTSGKMTRWIDFGGSVGKKEVWCDFDTPDESGGKGWMLTAKFTEAKRWGGNGVTIDTTTSYIGPGDGYAVSANMADAPMNMFRVTVADSANQSLGSSARADWYYQWNLDTIPWKVVWQPEAWQNDRMLPTNGDKNYASTDGSTGPGRTSIRKFQKSYNIKHSYIPVGHVYQNLTDYMNSESLSSVSANGGTGAGNNWGGDYTYKLIGAGGSSNAAGSFNKWYALSNNGQKFEFYHEGRSADYANETGPDTDGTLGIVCIGTSKTHSGQDQDNENNVKIGYDDNTEWTHAEQSSNGSTGNTGGNKNTSANGYNMYWWIK